jgi:hypothetical protein
VAQPQTPDPTEELLDAIAPLRGLDFRPVDQGPGFHARAEVSIELGVTFFVAADSPLAVVSPEQRADFTRRLDDVRAGFALLVSAGEPEPTQPEDGGVDHPPAEEDLLVFTTGAVNTNADPCVDRLLAVARPLTRLNLMALRHKNDEYHFRPPKRVKVNIINRPAAVTIDRNHPQNIAPGGTTGWRFTDYAHVEGPNDLNYEIVSL